MINRPLSVWKYYRHNRRKVNIVFCITFLGTFLQCVLLIFATTCVKTNFENPFKILREVAMVGLIKPTRANRQALVRNLHQQSSVAKVIPFIITNISVTSGMGNGWLMFVKNSELKPLMQTFQLRLIQGRLPRAGTPEVVLDWRFAANKGLKIGDYFSGKLLSHGLMAQQYQLSGLCDGQTMIGFADLDRYFHDSQFSEERTGILIVPQPGQLAPVTEYLNNLNQEETIVTTTSKGEKSIKNEINQIFLQANMLVLIITSVAALCAGFLFYLYFYQRRSEIGILEALGHNKQCIIARTFAEIWAINLLAFGSALGLSLVGGWTLNHFLLAARGIELVLWDPANLLKLGLTPLLITCCSLIPVWRMIKKVDPVSIVESSGEFAFNEAQTKQPLSTRNYFRHNPRRVGAVLSVIFLSSFLQSAFLVYYTSYVRLSQRCEDELWDMIASTNLINHSPEKLSQLHNTLTRHRSVARVIPFNLTQLTFTGIAACSANLLTIDANEVPPVMQALHLKLVAGRLPSANSGEVLLHRQLAANHRLKIGDWLNNDPKLRLVGLVDGESILGLGAPKYPTNDWHYSKNDLPLLVIPRKNQFGEMSLYLAALMQKDQNLMTSTGDPKSNDVVDRIDPFLIVYWTVSTVVTLCVGFLFYLYFYHRRPEFGMLEALGHTRPMIMGRILREIITLTLSGFGLGLTLTYLVYCSLSGTDLFKRSLPLVLWDPSYLTRLLPFFLGIILGSLFPIWRMLDKIDPIAMSEGAK